MGLWSLLSEKKVSIIFFLIHNNWANCFKENTEIIQPSEHVTSTVSTVHHTSQSKCTPVRMYNYKVVVVVTSYKDLQQQCLTITTLESWYEDKLRRLESLYEYRLRLQMLCAVCYITYYHHIYVHVSPIVYKEG